MRYDKTLHLIPVASGIAAQDKGCGDGPLVLQRSVFLNPIAPLHWHNTIAPNLTLPVSMAVAEVCSKIAKITHQLAKNEQFFVTIGGDHSCAIGTWSGAAVAHRSKGPLGLLWIDAHIDGHTPETTPSGAIHGMPVAALLGYGHPELTDLVKPGPKINPKHLVLVGIRSYEAEEVALMNRLGVKIVYMDEVLKRGLQVVIREALQWIRSQTSRYGITIDLDALDPQDAPGVGSPVATGIRCQALCEALALARDDPALLGLEIAEFNPHLDQHQQTEKTIVQLIEALVRP